MIPSQTQKPDSTSSALDSLVALGDIAPPLEGSMIALSLAEAGGGLDNLELEATFSSALTNREYEKKYEKKIRFHTYWKDRLKLAPVVCGGGAATFALAFQSISFTSR